MFKYGDHVQWKKVNEQLNLNITGTVIAVDKLKSGTLVSVQYDKEFWTDANIFTFYARENDLRKI